jgi:hypothetical protein
MTTPQFHAEFTFATNSPIEAQLLIIAADLVLTGGKNVGLEEVTWLLDEMADDCLDVADNWLSDLDELDKNVHGTVAVAFLQAAQRRLEQNTGQPLDQGVVSDKEKDD